MCRIVKKTPRPGRCAIQMPPRDVREKYEKNKIQSLDSTKVQI
jgi:hypothetical protein